MKNISTVLRPLEFLMIVSSHELAKYVSQFKNITLFVDLEVLGKDERQGHLDTVRSSLTFRDVPGIREAAPDANMLVRINPLNENSMEEINSVINSGADSIMLPMFHSLGEVDDFLRMIEGRARAVPLFETAKSIEALPEIVSKLNVDQIHIGLNDLHLDLGKDFLFEPLSDGFLEEASKTLRDTNIKFGIGGIARASEGLLRPELVLGEHVRLGSSVAILSRAFHKDASTVDQLTVASNFSLELAKLERIYVDFQSATNATLEDNRIKTWQLAKKIAQKIRSSR
ncbi:aldolase/citrate lyase family protein [Pseudomonadales bacterium]|nr:aldolase/citrate lyase family protein [Pseudomonadales bacterium]